VHISGVASEEARRSAGGKSEHLNVAERERVRLQPLHSHRTACASPTRIEEARFFWEEKSKLFIELLVCLYALIAEYVAILCTVLYSCQPWCLCSVQDAETLTQLPRQRAACVVAVAHCVVWGRFLDVGGGKNLWLCQNFVTHSSRCGANVSFAQVFPPRP
jgi:hypothetical protein